MCLVGCRSGAILRHGQTLENGDLIAAIRYYDSMLQRYPNDRSLHAQREKAVSRLAIELTAKARQLLLSGDYSQAAQIMTELLDFSPHHPVALDLLSEAKKRQQAEQLAAQARNSQTSGKLQESLELWRQARKLTPDDDSIEKRITQLEQAIRASVAAAPQPAEVVFEDAALSDVVQALASITGLNLLLSPDLNDRTVSLHIQNAPLERVLDHFLVMTGLFKVQLDAQTYLLVPDNPENHRRYKRVETKMCYLSSADATKVNEILKPLAGDVAIIVNASLNAIVVSGTPEQIEMIEEVIKANDKREMEVVLEIEVLEVNRSKLRELGVELDPYRIGAVAAGPLEKEGSGTVTGTTLQNIGQGNVLIQLPKAYAAFLKDDTATRVLANPKLRILNGTKAELHIGEKVPIKILTSVFHDTREETSSYEYRDIGLKLEVLPAIHLDREITMDLLLEVSSITSQNADLQPTIGTRQVKTSLRIADEQTEIIAGLIKTEERTQHTRIPLLGDLPLAGNFFGVDKRSAQETEIIMTLTPHMLHHPVQELPTAQLIWSGAATELAGYSKGPANPSTRPAGGGAGGLQRGITLPGSTNTKPEENSSTGGGTPQTANITPVDTVAVISIFPTPIRFMRNEDVAAQIRIAQAANVASVPFYLTFDPAVINILEVREGSYLNGDGTPTAFMSAIDNAHGRLIIGMSRLGANTGADGDGLLLSFTIRGLAAGVSALHFSNATVRDPAAQLLPSRFIDASAIIQ